MHAQRATPGDVPGGGAGGRSASAGGDTGVDLTDRLTDEVQCVHPVSGLVGGRFLKLRLRVLQGMQRVVYVRLRRDDGSGHEANPEQGCRTGGNEQPVTSGP